MKHNKVTINHYRMEAQLALSKKELMKTSDLINLMAYYGTQEAENIYLRLYQ